MAKSEEVKGIVIISLIIAVFTLVFFILKPIIIPIIFGLLCSYIFYPLYRQINKRIKNQNLATSIFVTILTIIIVVPIVYFVPSIVNQAFDTYVKLQSLNFTEIIQSLIKTNLASTLAINIDNIIGQFFTTFLNQFKDMILNLPILIFQFAVFLFTFYFSTRDADKLKEYIGSLSPLPKETEKKFLREFRGITNAIVFGQVFIGIMQGLALGAGLFLLGVPNTLILTLVAAISSIIPILGSWLVWLPVSVYMLVTDQIFAGVFLFLYGALFVSSIDNLIRPYILSKNSTLPVALSLIGIIGGLFFFGIIGLLLGPLVIAYALIILEFYRKGKLKDLFNQK